MDYQELIIKIQELKASIDKDIALAEENNYYYVNCSKERYISMKREFSDELDNLLISEEDTIKKYFKY